jgi:very-short-patch-repair endonuclease
VEVIPKPPPGFTWQQWVERHQAKRRPQRGDFLLAYEGKRHIVEPDDIGHYGERRGREWIASEPQYRETLGDTRWLRQCGFEVYRFTNEELLELYNPDSSIEADIRGFVELLQAEGLNLDDMVLQDSCWSA